MKSLIAGSIFYLGSAGQKTTYPRAPLGGGVETVAMGGRVMYLRSYGRGLLPHPFVFTPVKKKEEGTTWVYAKSSPWCALRVRIFRISDRFGPFTPSRARSPINAKSLQSQGWECRKRPSGSGKLARSRYNQVGARSVHTPMAGWPAGALVPSSPKVRLGLAHPPAYAHGSPRPPSPAWLLCRDAR